MRETDLLDRYLAQERARPFVWGRGNGDCLLFLLGWAELHSLKASHQWRGTYSDEQSARKSLDAFGGAAAAVCDVLGPPRMGSLAQRGDVGLLETDGWHLGMICTGSMWALRDGRRGVRMVRRAPNMVWPVGFA